MAWITPGVDYLARSLVIVILLAALTVYVRHLNTEFNLFIPTWLLVSVSALTIPLFAATRIIYNEISYQRQAAAVGARLAPKAQGKWIGNLDVLMTMVKHWSTGYPGDGLWELMEAHGPVVNFHVLWANAVITASPEHIKIVLATDFNNYVKGERLHQSMGSVLGKGVFNSDGDMWKFHRSMTRPFFSRDRISHFELFDRHAEGAITQMKLRMRAGYAIDFQDLISRFTLDSATDILFGSCVNSLSAGLPYPHNVTSVPHEPSSMRTNTANEFAKAFLQCQELISERELLGWVWPLFEIFKDKTAEPMRVVNAYLEPIIKDALEKKRLAAPLLAEKQAEAEVRDDQTLLDHLVNFTSDPVVLRDETLNILIAGRDTTAATLTFIIYFLSIYPSITSRLRDEIISKVGPTRRPNYEDIRDMKFLRAVINETLRLYPVVPFNVRDNVNATTWPSANPAEKPIYIPAGTKILYSVFMMHRRKDLWGPDADEFDPDRFLDDRLKKYLISNSFIFLPFNAGPRICLGQQFAYYEMSFMIIRLLQNFTSIALDPLAARPECLPPADWSNTIGRKAIEKFFPKVHLTMYSAGGLWLKMQEAEMMD